MLDIVEARQRYVDHMAPLVPGFRSGVPLGVADARCLLERAVTSEPILDLGAGFSTFVFKAAGLKFDTYEHDPTWRSLVSAQLEVEILSKIPSGRYGLIFVDHGPTMQSRLDVMERLCKQASLLVLDDWRGSYRRSAASILRSCGMKLSHIEGSRLGWARRP